jgi:hypothetical protein
MNYPIQQSKPQYYPKIDSYTNEARDLDLSELRRKYPIGFKCTQEFKENLGDSDSLLEAFEKKCRENRELKKLNLQKQLEIDKEKFDKDRILQRNIDLQEEIKELKTKNKPVKFKVREQNLIDLLN